MAVYTDVSDEELESFITSYDIGALTSFKGIAEGVENSNYLVHTESGP
jgi:homoserine kinase type II